MVVAGAEALSGEAKIAAALRIRPTEPSDLPAIQTIYAHHVLHGLASWEEVPPDLAEMTARFDATLERGDPYLSAELDGEIAGYAYASPYRPRPAYRYVRENSVYVSPERQRLGIGGALLEALIAECTLRGTRRLIAIIGDSGNAASIGLHKAHGFQDIGVIPSIGFKFGRWLDSVLLQRPLGEGDSSLPELPSVERT